MPEPEDPIAEAKRLLADKALYADNVRHLWRADVAKRAPRLLAALCERLEAAEHKHCRLHRCGNCAVCKKSGRWGSTVPAE